MLSSLRTPWKKASNDRPQSAWLARISFALVGSLFVHQEQANAQTPAFKKGADAFAEPVEVLHELVGEAAGDQYGWIARSVGDMDEDGFQDFLVTAPTWKTGGQTCGKVYVYSGSTAELIHEFEGTAGSQFGMTAAPAGDFDEDGIGDLVVGAPGFQGTGAVYVYSGFDGRQLLCIVGEESGAAFGRKACGVADLNEDGLPELAIGAISSGVSGATSGCVYVYSGDGEEVLAEIPGEAAGDQFGSGLDAELTGKQPLLAVGAMGHGGTGKAYVYKLSAKGAEPHFVIEPDSTSANLGQFFVCMIGDVNADGAVDIYASDWNNSAGGPATGRVFVHSGTDGKRLLTLTGTTPGEGFGTSPSQAGDVNGDGHDDLIVGAWQNSEKAAAAGKCYLHSGKDGKLLATYTCTQAGDTFGFDATNLGDVNDDGRIDFLLTSAWSRVHGPQTGRVFVISAPEFPAGG